MIQLNWSTEAEAAMSGVPGFVRGMARKAVEDEALKHGINEITPELVRAVKDKYFTSIFGGKKEEKVEVDRVNKGDKKPHKIAIIRCETVSETCPGIACMLAWNKKKINFAGYGSDDELIAMLTCGGCSGRRVSRMVEKLKKYGLDTVHLSSCMLLEGDYPKCPHLAEIKQSILAKGIEVVEGTHH